MMGRISDVRVGNVYRRNDARPGCGGQVTILSVDTQETNDGRFVAGAIYVKVLTSRGVKNRIAIERLLSSQYTLIEEKARING